MLRFIARAFAIVAVFFPLTASAQFSIPAGVNLHNGYIEVINRVHYHDGFSWPGDVKLNDRHEGRVGTGGTFVINKCCILAGSHYLVELNYVSGAGIRVPVGVVPRLCNIHGIPFGYAVVEYTGNIRKTREGSGSGTRYETTDLHGSRVDTACPG